MTRYGLGLVGILLGASALAPAWADPPADPGQIVTFQVENDAVSTLKGTSDQYYTSGLRGGWVGATGQLPDFVAQAGRALLGPGGTQRVSLDISQSIYTPRQTQFNPPDPHDRPYAGYLALNGALITDTDNQRIVLGGALGVIGHIAGGEAIQNGFHNLIGDTANRGWGYQLRDEVELEVRPEITWRLPIAQFADFETDALPTLEGGAGNLRDYALAGVNFRFGQGLSSDYGVSRIEPDMSGTDAYTPTQPFAWYVFGGADGQAVAHDVLLDGNTSRDFPVHVSKKWDVGELELGAAVIWQGVRVTYSQTFQTEEFNGQKGGLFNFGSLAASVRF